MYAIVVLSADHCLVNLLLELWRRWDGKVLSPRYVLLQDSCGRALCCGNKCDRHCCSCSIGCELDLVILDIGGLGVKMLGDNLSLVIRRSSTLNLRVLCVINTLPCKSGLLRKTYVEMHRCRKLISLESIVHSQLWHVPNLDVVGL